MVRLILGFIVAALWLPALAYLTSRSFVGSLAGLIALFTVPLTLCAVPLYVLLRRRVTFWWCALAGLSGGVAGCLVDWLVTNTLSFSRNSAGQQLLHSNCRLTEELGPASYTYP